MKITMTVEFEVSDIPKKDRIDIINFGAMDDEEIPRISEMTEDEVRAELVDSFEAMFNGADYDSQAEMWAGSDFYGYITGFRILPTSQP